MMKVISVWCSINGKKEMRVDEGRSLESRYTKERGHLWKKDTAFPHDDLEEISVQQYVLDDLFNGFSNAAHADTKEVNISDVRLKTGISGKGKAGAPNSETTQSYSKTNDLRYLNKRHTFPVFVEGGTGVQFERVLQQKWQGSLGGVRWEDVPTVEEKGEKS